MTGNPPTCRHAHPRFPAGGFFSCQGFGLPGEAEKMANILKTFLGELHLGFTKGGGLGTDDPFGLQLIQVILNPRSTPSRKRSRDVPGALISSWSCAHRHPTTPVRTSALPFSSLKVGCVPGHQSRFCIPRKSRVEPAVTWLPDGSWSALLCSTTRGLGCGLDSVRLSPTGENVTMEGNASVTVGPIGTGGAVQASLASWCGCPTSTLHSLPPLCDHPGVDASFLVL